MIAPTPYSVAGRAAAMAAEGDWRLSIYRAVRRIKRRESSLLYNALRSIYEDSVFVAEIAGLWPALPLVANLRCGRWYGPRFDAACYFKSTDGHTGNWAFSTARLNLHLALLAGQRGGCIIVDSTRKGKRFPDSMSKTIPIWVCVLNRAIEKHLQRIAEEKLRDGESESNISHNATSAIRHMPAEWDSALHLPLWVPNSEKEAIKDHLEEWTKQFEACGADIDSLVASLRKPLRPLWISQRTLIWLNEVPEYDSWDFTPIILVSASATNGIIQQRMSSDFSWHYISGAGDDEESWARGLSPELFWKHAFDFIDCGPDLCNQTVAEIVEKERVYRAQRGEFSPQATIKPKFSVNSSASSQEAVNFGRQLKDSELLIDSENVRTLKEDCSLYWIASTNLAVASNFHVPSVPVDVDCILDCDGVSKSFSCISSDDYLHLPIVASKVDRFSVIKNLCAAIDFAKLNLGRGKRVLVCCHDGEDISVCVCLAIVTALFDERGLFDGGKSFLHSPITKLDLRRRLVFICKYAVNARPSRGNLKQVFGFLSQRKESYVFSEHDADCI